MRVTLAGLIIVLILMTIALNYKMIFGSNPFASAQTISASRSDGISIHELHRNHPDMENLQRQDAPSP